MTLNKANGTGRQEEAAAATADVISQLHQHAMQLVVECRLAVFPLKPGDKAPATKRGFKNATNDASIVDSWWRDCPDQNIGIATGKTSGVWVLDVDGEEGEASLARLVAEHGPLPETVEAITGKGRHIYFRYVEGIGCTAGSIGLGIDTRGDNGYVVAPPSLHPSGRRYAWSVDSSADGFADAPAWLVARARVVSKPAREAATIPIIPTADVTALIAKLTPSLKRRIATEGKGDRSTHSFGVMAALFDAGLTISDVAAIARVSAFAAKFLERGDLDAEIGRAHSRWTAAKAKREAEADDDLAAMNTQHAVVRVGGKTRVMRLEGLPGRPDALVPVYSSFRDFKDFHDRGRRAIVDEENGEVKRIGLGTWWLKQEGRAQYNAVVFEPGASEDEARSNFNLWRGFAVGPVEGECSLYLQHITDNICSGNDEHANYMLDWMAYNAQYPGERPEVAVIFRGDEGTGKGMAIRPYGELFGPHYIHISQPGHLTGHFNAHLQCCKVLFADEAFFAGDRRHENVLKAFVTEPTLMIEPKGVDPYPVRNVIALLMSSNHEFVVPAGKDARRYFVLDVSDARKQDHAYFEAIAHEMANGGHEALLYFLLNRDLSGFEVRKVPQTEALADQKARSRRGVDLLVEMLASEGALPEAHGSYANIAITSGEAKGEGFWPRVCVLVPGLKHESSTVIGTTLKRGWGCETWEAHGRCGLKFPPLWDLRAKFDARHGPQAWSARKEWSENAGDPE